ncbi:hypothetical protein MettiDRAFT_1722 [Methanolobus tindarius DSM 2278]|uniref:Uncharacterized protein n=1 Tax=Methanolobus tindarius DSM 2278 TaxID=1090322 RepID=W9DXX1_METTI|nr:hypothetical protein [Methanolobus tindarius]ETA68266.1 hypothetical protein MettiDRAFT_1722 [Methanolobus tindarius DSM 2278]
MPPLIKMTMDFPSGQQTYMLSEEKAFEILRIVLMNEQCKTAIVQNPNEPLDIPDAEELTDYIKSLPSYTFTVEDVTTHYVANSDEIDKDEMTRWTNAVRSKLSRIRDKIADEESGNWDVKKNGLVRTYTFVKDNTDKNTESEMDKWI